ncbi:hypothetical protein ACWT_2917 [Actinoplanes sp. SE50]|uniref:hypothetical protein n=1 Tax=unclassified Actinoplanes TaxID=2626549 RepID=UPI00023EC0A0|nr:MULTISPECIES: hypothetical protein [unclassified Actinoplanes]AEV83524.1 hypothetical protein ACPL_2629 [Actinoplanes sp. SE50/110]ATO82332.1 hypothetical protein ACWT_2917 [Actinoplanes sp. SE50]SLL99739.1 hypothetical protein ACSP50_2970 [Actinoplanes sp. SE50/110]
MGYTGVIVVGRSARLLVHEEGMDDFGYQHRYVRPLGDGWQLVETGGHLETLELREPCRRLAMSTGRPVLAAQVFDSDRALLCTAVGHTTGLVTCRYDVLAACGDEDGARTPPGATGRPVGDVVSGLLAWSAAAGLPADPAAVRTVVTGDQLADDAVFALVGALGVAGIGRTLPRAFPVESWPFSPLSTLAYLARMSALGRARAGEAEPMASWE